MVTCDNAGESSGTSGAVKFDAMHCVLLAVITCNGIQLAVTVDTVFCRPCIANAIPARFINFVIRYYIVHAADANSVAEILTDSIIQDPLISPNANSATCEIKQTETLFDNPPTANTQVDAIAACPACPAAHPAGPDVASTMRAWPGAARIRELHAVSNARYIVTVKEH